jgi:hypothetical protein
MPKPGNYNTKEEITMVIDLSLKSNIYQGCEIAEVSGRLTLMTPPVEAANIVGRNAASMVEACKDRQEVTLTGPMAVWAYLVVFHVVVHRFSRVYYDDGRNWKLLIAQH